MKCPHCNGNIDVKLIKAPANTSGAAYADISDIGELLDAINDDALEGKSVEFVAETRKRYAQYKDRIRLSEKQVAWLRTLANPDESPF